VYRGTLGKQEIIAEISAEPDKPRAVTGHYFYSSQGISISLKGVHAQDGSFLLAEYKIRKTPGDSGTSSSRMTRLLGRFCKCDLRHASVGKTLRIHLSRISSGPGQDCVVSAPSSSPN